MFPRQRGHSGISLEAANYKTEVSVSVWLIGIAMHKIIIIAFYYGILQCATLATGSTVHHKLNSTSKPSLSILSAPPHVLPPMLSLCLPFLQSLLTHRQGSKGHLDEDMAESEVGDLFRGRRSARSGCGL